MVSEAPLELVLRLIKKHDDRAMFAIAIAQEIQNLRAALAEAERERDFQTKRAESAESYWSKDRDLWRVDIARAEADLAAAHAKVTELEQWPYCLGYDRGKLFSLERAHRAEADLATAREVMAALVLNCSCLRDMEHAAHADARAFLERTK